MSINAIAEGYLTIAGNSGTISNPLTVSGTVSLPSTTNLNGTSLQSTLDAKVPSVNPTLSGTVALPSTTNLNGSSLQSTIDAKVPLSNPTFSGTVAFENLQINSVPFSTVVSNAAGGSSTITFGTPFIVSGDIYTIHIPFSASVAIPYTANIVVNEINGVAMTVVITEYNTNYVRFRIMKPVFDYIVISSFSGSLKMNCAIMKGASVLACGNVVM